MFNRCAGQDSALGREVKMVTKGRRNLKQGMEPKGL